MRLMVLFDLPVVTAAQRKTYRRFRKNLIKEGYLMMQQSVYTKLVINENAASLALQRLSKISPREGLVQVIKVTERQYATMVYVTGNQKYYEELESTEEFVVI